MTLARLITLCLLSFVTTHVTAEDLRDPTQLPSTFSPMASTEEVGTSGPVLQSIILSDAMRAAIINGQKINLGEDYAQSTLVGLTENSATLKAADGKKQVLKMPHISFGIKQRPDNASDLSRQSFATKTIR